MKVVIQCAASKHAEAGYFRTAGPAPTTVKFVADGINLSIPFRGVFQQPASAPRGRLPAPR